MRSSVLDCKNNITLVYSCLAFQSCISSALIRTLGDGLEISGLNRLAEAKIACYKNNNLKSWFLRLSGLIEILQRGEKVKKKLLNPVILLLSLLIILQDLCLAEEPAVHITMPPIIISASRIPIRLEEAPANIEVIDGETIESLAPVGIVDTLRRVPGLHIDQPGGEGARSSVYMRGADPNYILILVDGIKVNDPTDADGGAFDFSSVDVRDVERIEILEGPLSSVYGSEAVAGAINIITRSGEKDFGFGAEIGVGTDEYYHGDAFIEGGLFENAGYNLDFGLLDAGEQVPGDSFTGYNINGKIGSLSDDKNRWNALIRYSDSSSETYPDDSGGPEYAVIEEVESRESEAAVAGVEYQRELFSRFTFKLKGNWFNRKSEIDSPGVAPGERDPMGIPASYYENSLNRLNLSAYGYAVLNQYLRAGLGADFEQEEGESDGYLMFGEYESPIEFDLDRSITGVFTELTFIFHDVLNVRAALRADSPEDFDVQWSPGIGAMWKINATDTTLKFNWGRGFKLPSFYALGNPIVGNEDLDPERSQSFDFGLQQKFIDERLMLGAGLFHNTFYDAIDFEEGPPPRLVNRSEITSEGFELEAAVHFGDKLMISTHYSYAATDIKDTEEELRNRPEKRGGLDIDWNMTKNISMAMAVTYVGEILDSSIPTGDVMLDDYMRTDLAASWNISKVWKATLAVDNLFDEDYQEAVGFPAPGITPRLSLAFRQ